MENLQSHSPSVRYKRRSDKCIDRSKLEHALSFSSVAHAFSGVISIRHKGDVLFARDAGHADRSNMKDAIP
jgi:hypothetical protein